MNLGTPIGKEFKTPGYAERKARQISSMNAAIEEVTAEAQDEERMLSVVLTNKGLPDLIPYREEPWHRHAALCYAMGMTPKEIAKQCDMSLGAVYKLIRRREWQANVTAIIEAQGFGDIMHNFRGEVIASLATIVEIRDDEKAPKAVRRQCAMDIIERCMGKAKQTIEHSQTATSSDPVEEVKRLDAQNRSMREEIFKGGVN